MATLAVVSFVVLMRIFSAAAYGELLIDLDSEISAAVRDCGHRSGLAVAVVSRNESLGSFAYAKGFGLRNIKDNSQADENTLLCIGSVTKHFTAVLLVHLLDLLRSSGHSSRYSLQTAVTDLDPTLLFPGSELIGVTLEDILSHRTGLADYFGPLRVGYPANYSFGDIAHIATKLPRLAASRQRFIYNNHVFALAGHASEILGSIYHNRNVTWEDLVKIHIADKLGITDDLSFADPASGYESRVALPYVTVGGSYKPVPFEVAETVKPAAPAGAICMSPKAMAVWMEFLLNRGIHNNTVAVKREAIEETWKPRIRGDADYEGLQYALGWIVDDAAGTRIVRHDGTISTYTSNFILYPELNYAFMVSSSGGYSPNVNGLHVKLLDIFARAVNTTAAESFFGNFTCGATPVPAPDHSDVPSVTKDMHLYTGTYSHPLYGTMTLKDQGSGGLVMEVGRIGKGTIQCHHSGSCILTYTGALSYLSEQDGSIPVVSQIEFGRSCSGYTVNVTMPLYSPGPGPAVHFTRPGLAAEHCTDLDSTASLVTSTSSVPSTEKATQSKGSGLSRDANSWTVTGLAFVVVILVSRWR